MVEVPQTKSGMTANIQNKTLEKPLDGIKNVKSLDGIKNTSEEKKHEPDTGTSVDGDSSSPKPSNGGKCRAAYPRSKNVRAVESTTGCVLQSQRGAPTQHCQLQISILPYLPTTATYVPGGIDLQVLSRWSRLLLLPQFQRGE